MLWVLGKGTHPLQIILRCHIQQASERRWGTADLSWTVSQCGTMKISGSAPWRRICSSWATLRRRLKPKRPANLEEWKELPLWRPHLNHIDGSLARCSSIPQKALRDSGFNRMGDVLDTATSAISWAEARRRGAPQNCEAAFRQLVLNLQLVPILDQPEEPHDLFLQGMSLVNNDRVWQFRIKARHLSERWLPFMIGSEPIRTFRYTGHYLVPITTCKPDSQAILKRIIVRSPKFANSHLHMGEWTRENLLLTQYKWKDGTGLLHSSTAQLRLLQVADHSRPHSAFSKWENQLACTIPTEIWNFTWIPYCSAAENTFLWQLLYRIPATNRWRFPDRPSTDPNTWCPRCPLNVLEDNLHCIWACGTSRRCWEWCSQLISWVASGHHRGGQLTPAHVLVGEPLPVSWDAPHRLWHTIRAIMCWTIWKNRNLHVFTGEISNTDRMIGQAWARLRVYVMVAWKELLVKVRMHKFTLAKDVDRMSDMFGHNGRIWTVHGTDIHLPSIPPRPP